MHDPLSEKVEKLSIGMGKWKYYSKLGLKKKAHHKRLRSVCTRKCSVPQRNQEKWALWEEGNSQQCEKLTRKYQVRWGL